MAESALTGQKFPGGVLHAVMDMYNNIVAFENFFNECLSGGGCAQRCQQKKCHHLRQNAYEHVFQPINLFGFNTKPRLPDQMLVWEHTFNSSQNCQCRHMELCADCTAYFQGDRLSISRHVFYIPTSMDQLMSHLSQLLKHITSLPSTPEIRIIEQYVQTSRAIIFPGKFTKAARREVREL
jgi:hypothetical protein